VADIALVRFLVGVRFLVIRQIRRVSKTFLTPIATKRLRPGVNPFMDIQF
jgi:hypothetical protein